MGYSIFFLMSVGVVGGFLTRCEQYHNGAAMRKLSFALREDCARIT